TQVVKSNATFNAFVVPGPPELMEELVPVSMTRELELEDDMKEYWGFYLLQGSTVTVSACVSWPGASLIMIKGYKHLQECAYIGDDSSEELDELMESYKLGLMSNTTLLDKINKLNKEDGKANDPGTMKRHKPGVSFHDPNQTANVTSSDNVPTNDVTDHDPKELRQILERLHALRQAAKTESAKFYHPPPHLMSLPALHRHRDANVDRDERRWLTFKDIDTSISEQIKSNSSKTKMESADIKSVIQTASNTTKNTTNTNLQKEIDLSEEDNLINSKSKHSMNDKRTMENGIKNNANTKLNTKDKDPNSKEEANSKEVFDEVLKQLQGLGDRGKRVLARLHKTMGVAYQDQASDTVTRSDEDLDHLRNVLVEAIDEEKTRKQRQQRRRQAMEDARHKRELLLGQIELQKQFNEDDEARDFAAEEGLEPDGFAEHHNQINETTAFDMSNSEFWSSFSSSEEALLECAGLILNLPLTPHSSCRPGVSESQSHTAARANALTYRVPANGYYFFVFNSENEVQRNFIRARFDLQKTRYDVARTTLRECRNSTERCDLPLDIFSSQKVVLELPLRNNDSLWNEQFVIISECEPRTSVYMACVIAVPILILLFAFQ
ncbi:jg7824, partial [Pararge aegeria aegeria]